MPILVSAHLVFRFTAEGALPLMMGRNFWGIPLTSCYGAVQNEQHESRHALMESAKAACIPRTDPSNCFVANGILFDGMPVASYTPAKRECTLYCWSTPVFQEVFGISGLRVSLRQKLCDSGASAASLVSRMNSLVLLRLPLSSIYVQEWGGCRGVRLFMGTALTCPLCTCPPRLTGIRSAFCGWLAPSDGARSQGHRGGGDERG